MSYRTGRVFKKDKHSKVNEHKYASISKNLEDVYRWSQYPERVINGEGFVLFEGEWMPKKKFLKENPSPAVANFNADLTNVDSTSTCLI